MFNFSPKFRLAHKLEGPQDAVLSLSCSENARFLTATGYNGVAVWELETLTPVVVPEQYGAPKSSRYMPTACAWLYLQSPDTHVLLLGTVGEVIAWRWNESKKIFEPFGRATTTWAQVTSMDVGATDISSGNTCVVAAFADHTVTVWDFTPDGTFQEALSVTLNETFLPKAVFLEKKTHHIYTFALDGGKVALLSRTDGSVLWQKKAAHEFTGSVSVDPSWERFVIGTGKDFQVLDTSTLDTLRTLEGSGPLVVPRSMQVSITANGAHFVTGTDSGQAILHNITDGTIMQKLRYPRGGLVQTVTAFATKDYQYIVTAGSSPGDSADVLIWHNKPRVQLRQVAEDILIGMLMVFVYGPIMCLVVLYYMDQESLTM
ncbi:hypothetical protein AAF712_007982 [Marasmius tenuissimus]|uniref:Uncharacterized protein n=1 Tax=Marasmius tenuissimus TaxID=585030 RepID=A0ABR2ZTT5_9AGAR